MLEDNESHDVKEIQMSWNRMKNNIKTIALGDGLSTGKDNNYQKYFNKGFSEGFGTGLFMGQRHGTLFGESVLNKQPIHENKLLERPKRAWCQICTDQNLGEKTLSEVVKQQTEVNRRNMAEL